MSFHNPPLAEVSRSDGGGQRTSGL